MPAGSVHSEGLDYRWLEPGHVWVSGEQVTGQTALHHGQSILSPPRLIDDSKLLISGSLLKFVCLLYLFFPPFLLPLQIESFSSPMHRWRTVPLFSVMMPSVGCVVIPGLRWCRSPAPAASCMDLTPGDRQSPRWLKLCWEQRRERWRSLSTLKMVWSC